VGGGGGKEIERRGEKKEIKRERKETSAAAESMSDNQGQFVPRRPDAGATDFCRKQDYLN
jgi:hypothetical protein